MCAPREREQGVRPQRARELLGLPRNPAPDAVRAAFAAAVKAAHPDVGGAGGDFAALTEARDALINMAQDEVYCGQCNGKGVVRGRFGAVTCKGCDGEGTKQGATK